MPKNKKRPDGRIQKKVYLGTIDGVKQYKYVYGTTDKEVDDKILELRMSLKKGINIKSGRDTFEKWAAQWLAFKKTGASYNNFNRLKTQADCFSSLYDTEIVKIRTSDIQLLMNHHAVTPRESTDKPYSKESLKGLKQAAVAIFKTAIKDRVIDYNPAVDVDIPDVTQTEKRRALTDEEQQWVINTPHRAQRAAMIMMFSGLRRGELIPLTWSDIDLADKTIIVNKSVEMIKGRAVVKNTAKSKSGLRTVYIPQILADFLQNEKRTQLLVCPNTKGAVMSSSSWKRLWESYMCELNLKYGDFSDCVETKGETPQKYAPKKAPMVIEGFTAHYLRHTFITMMYHAGIDVLTAKEQAGHADIKTTMEIYTHLDAGFKKKSMQKLDDYISADIRKNLFEIHEAE